MNIIIKEYGITLENIAIKEYYIDSIITRTYKEHCNPLTDSPNQTNIDSTGME
jgi:hypothetical protein